MSVGYIKTLKYTLKSRDLSSDEEKELNKIVSTFLIGKGFESSKISNLRYNLSFSEIWHKCLDIIK